MNMTLPKLVRQMFAVGLLLVAVAAVAGFVVLPISNHIQQLRSQVEQERLVLGHLLALRDASAAGTDAAQAAVPETVTKLTLEGESDAIRAANLQTMIGAIAARSGVQMRSLRNLPARDRSDIRVLGVQIQFLATIEQLQQAILAIETQQPYLFIDQLQITPLPGAMAGESETPGLLDARLDIVGATDRQRG